MNGHCPIVAKNLLLSFMEKKPMLNKCWKNHLQTILNQKTNRIAVLGIGHELRGDDAVGIHIIRQLQRFSPPIDNRLLLEAGSAPENLTGQLRRFTPHTILLIDAVDMSQPSGMIQFIDLFGNIIESVSSTHTLSLRLFTTYIKTEFNCDVHLMGIQVEQTKLDTPLSTSVQSSAEFIVKALITFFHY